MFCFKKLFTIKQNNRKKLCRWLKRLGGGNVERQGKREAWSIPKYQGGRIMESGMKSESEKTRLRILEAVLTKQTTAP